MGLLYLYCYDKRINSWGLASLLLCNVTRGMLVAGNRRFGTTNRSHPQRSGSPKNALLQGVGPIRCPETSLPTNKDYWPSNMGPLYWPDMSVRTNKYLPLNMGPLC